MKRFESHNAQMETEESETGQMQKVPTVITTLELSQRRP